MNTLNGYSKSTLTDNNVLTAAGGHLAVGNADQNIPINNGTVNTNLNADLLDNLHASDFLQYVSQNATFSSVANISTDLTPGIHKIHISTVEYSSILTGKDYNGSYWQLYFHPSSSYTQDIKYRATNCTTWKTLLDSNNYTSYLPILNSASTHATKSSVIYAPTSAGTQG
jgi:hypothetical protein